MVNIKEMQKQIAATNVIGQKQGFVIETCHDYHLVSAIRDFQLNEVVIKSKCMSFANKRDQYSLQKSAHHHIIMTLPAILLNHSCDSNLGIIDNDDNAYNFIAFKKIQAGDELTFDYETAEEAVNFFSQCNCGSNLCRKIICGFRYHEELIRKKYGEFIANYLKVE